MYVRVPEEFIYAVIAHVGHELEVGIYSNTDGPIEVSIECLDCHKVIVTFGLEDEE